MDACMTKPKLIAIVKPTYDCNLGCLYCYEGGRECSSRRMSQETLRNVITRLAEYHGTEETTDIIWHGGEPLLMGLEFFRSIVRIQNDLGPDFTFINSVQTNGTLLSNEILDFFTEHDFTVGTSLDGPSWLHDFTRPYLGGNSSYRDTMRALERIHARSQQPPYKQLGGGVIAVLSRPALAHLDEFYEFFRDNHISAKINPIFYVGSGLTVRDKLGITPREYGEAMVYLFDRWFDEKQEMVPIDPFDMLLGNLITNDPRGCQFASACFDSYVAVGPDGDVYPCGRWSPSQPYSLGNLNQQSFIEIRSSPVLEEFRRARRAANENCYPCEFLPICNSGCIENAYLIRQRLDDRDYYCSGYRLLFSHIKDRLIGAIHKATTDHESAEKEMDGDKAVQIFEREVNLSRLENGALAQVIESRLLNTEQAPMGYTECKETRYRVYTEYNKYMKYAVKWSEYSEYNRYSRAWRDQIHREHRQGACMCMC